MRRFHAYVCRACWLRPSLADLLPVTLMGWLFVAGQGWTALLADGDTGWHIRTGDWILRTRSVPTRDLFSFSRMSEPWFAWEWLSDVIFSLLHQSWGLAGVAAFSGCVLALSTLVIFRQMLWRGASAVIALPVVLVMAGASSIHYLARPHIFTLLLLAASLWIIERDRRWPSRTVWWLVPLSVLWVNLHGGFFALPACLILLAAGSGSWSTARRYATLAAAVLVASIVNPYGIGLHRHVLNYLSSDWIRGSVEEFQSPRFRGENLLHFELLLLGGLMLAGWLTARRRFADALLVAVWAHLSLASVRHAPLYAMVAAPLLAAEVSNLWGNWAARRAGRSPARVLWELGRDLQPDFRRLSVWSLVAAAAAVLLTPASKWPKDFPEAKFPVASVRAQEEHLKGIRVFTSDQWGDYLIYRLGPRQRVFIDGRSDFYGPTTGGDYLSLMEGRPGWEGLLCKYDFGAALLPPSWPLAALLERQPAWKKIASDRIAVLYTRLPPANPPGAIRR